MRYVKRPIPVEAYLWNGEAIAPSHVRPGTIHDIYELPFSGKKAGIIDTAEGRLTIVAGEHYIVGPGTRGEFWPVHRETFEATYMPADRDG